MDFFFLFIFQYDCLRLTYTMFFRIANYIISGWSIGWHTQVRPRTLAEHTTACADTENGRVPSLSYLPCVLGTSRRCCSASAVPADRSRFVPFNDATAASAGARGGKPFLSTQTASKSSPHPARTCPVDTLSTAAPRFHTEHHGASPVIQQLYC